MSRLCARVPHYSSLRFVGFLKALLVLSYLLLGSQAGAHAATHVQQASKSDSTSKTYLSFAATFPAATASGDAVVLGVTYGNLNPTITASDNQGNAYNLAVKTYDSSHRQGCAILYALNIKGGGPTTVTVKFSSSVAYLALGIHEYSGIAASAALDGTAGKLGSGSGLTSGAVTTTASGDLIFGTGVEDSAGSGDTFAPGSGFAMRVNLGNAAAYADEDATQAAAGPVAATWTLSPGRSWIADVAAFKTAPVIAAATAAPSITGLSPTSGPVGTSVTINGANFGSSQGTNFVTFNGTTASVVSWSASSIVASVPGGATTGNVTVAVGGVVSNGVPFTVTVPPPVSVTIAPASSTVSVNQSASFAASVQNDAQNLGVSWSLSGSGCSGTLCGTLISATSTSVTYTAPANVPNPASVTLTATSLADNTKNASTAITVAPAPSASGGAVAGFAENHVSASNTQGNAVSRYTLRLPNGTQSGNCIIVGFQYGSVPGVTALVTDDKGNSYNVPISHDDGSQVVNLSFALNVLGGTQEIIITFSGGMPSYVSALASEFYNIATANALDGSSGNSGTGSSVTAGSFTPTTSGDLIYQFAVQDSSSNRINSWTQGSSPWALLSADVMDSSAAQYQVQSSAAAINPAMTMAPAQNFNSVAIALKAAVAGSAPPPGIRVVRVQHHSLPAYASSPLPLQFPSTGNLLVVAWIGVAGHDITGISDGNGNHYVSTGPAYGNYTSGDVQIYYAPSAITGTTMTGPSLITTGTDISGSTAVLLDIRGAAASPFDAAAGRAAANGTQSSSESVTAASITPSAPNGLIVTVIGVDSNTIDGVSLGNFLCSIPTPVASPNPVDQNNGWALNYNPDTATETFVWSTQGGPVNLWASIAVAFRAGPQ